MDIPESAPAERRLAALIGPFWSLPVYVSHPDATSMALVEPAGIPLLSAQQQVMEALLDRLGQRLEKGWAVPDHLLAKHLRGVRPNANPEDVVSWRAVHATVELKDSNPPEFYQEFAQIGLCARADSAKALFNQSCAMIQHWLVNKNKPVDLGFCELVPIPFRPNWKEVITRNAPQSKSTATHPTTLYEFNRLYNGKLFLVTRTGPARVLWGLEVRTKNAWHRAIALREQRRMAAAAHEHPLRYWTQIFKCIHALLPAIRRVYESHLSKIRYPGVWLVPRTEGWLDKLSTPGVPWVRRAEGARTHTPAYAHRPYAGPGKDALGRTIPKFIEATWVRGMFCLRLRSPNVRYRKSSLDKSYQRPF